MPLDFAGELAALKAARIRIELKLAQSSVWPERARDEQLRANRSIGQARDEDHEADPDRASETNEILAVWQNLNQSIDDLERRLTRRIEQDASRGAAPLANGGIDATRREPGSLAPASPASAAAFRTRVKVRARSSAVDPNALRSASAPTSEPAASAQNPGQPAAAGDDLTAIRGIDRDLAQRLSALGVTRFDQIVAWRRDDVRGVAQALGLGRLISRQNWIEQAALRAPQQALSRTVVDTRKLADAVPIAEAQPIEPSVPPDETIAAGLIETEAPPRSSTEFLLGPVPVDPAQATATFGLDEGDVALASLPAVDFIDPLPEMLAAEPKLLQPVVLAPTADAPPLAAIVETPMPAEPAGSAAVLAALLASYSTHEQIAAPLHAQDEHATIDPHTPLPEQAAHIVESSFDVTLAPMAEPADVCDHAGELERLAPCPSGPSAAEIAAAAAATLVDEPAIGPVVNPALEHSEKRSLFFAGRSLGVVQPAPSQVAALATDLKAIIRGMRTDSGESGGTTEPKPEVVMTLPSATEPLSFLEKMDVDLRKLEQTPLSELSRDRPAAPGDVDDRAAANGSFDAIERWKESVSANGAVPSTDANTRSDVTDTIAAALHASDQGADGHAVVGTATFEPMAEAEYDSGDEAEVEIVVRDVAVAVATPAVPAYGPPLSVHGRNRNRLSDRDLFPGAPARRPDPGDEASVVIVQRRSDESGTPDLAFYQETPLARRETKIRRFLQALNGDRR